MLLLISRKGFKVLKDGTSSVRYCIEVAVHREKDNTTDADGNASSPVDIGGIDETLSFATLRGSPECY